MIMIGNHNSNSNNKKQLFSGITKKYSTKIIFQTENETRNDTVIGNNEHNTQKEKTKINNVHFGDDIGNIPKNIQHDFFFKTSTG